jgi:hypothetical protein
MGADETQDASTKHRNGASVGKYSRRMAEPGTRMSGYPFDRRDPRRRRSALSGPVGDLEGMAGRILARYTGETVVIQDDGSQDRMPDIRIDYPDRSSAFVEVVSDIDPAYAAVARRIVDPKSTWTSRDLSYGWVLTVTRDCHLDALAPRVIELVAALETSGLGPASGILHRPAPTTHATSALYDLGVLDAWSHRAIDGEAGSIRLVAEGIEGPYDTNWHAVGAWIDNALASPGLGDVRSKLAATGADERHVFLGVTFSSPGEVFFALEQGKGFPPPPTLPTEITHLWIMRATSPGGRCLHWAPIEGWIDVQNRWRTA